MKNMIAFLAVSLVVLPMLFAQSDLPSADMSTLSYLGMVFAIEGDQLIIPDGSRRTNGNYLIIEEATGQKIERSQLKLPCEAMVEYKILPKGNMVVTRLVVLRYFDIIGGRFVPRQSF